MLTSSKARENSTAKRRRLETNPLANEHILEKILSFLDMDSLKLVQTVSKFWSNEGAKSLITKCYVSIPSDLVVEEPSLSKFEAFLIHKKKDSSMIPKIVVKSSRDFALWKELGVLGPALKSLKLIDVSDKKVVIIEHLLNNLLVLFNLPNLQYLNLRKLNESRCSLYYIIKALSSVTSENRPDSLKRQIPLVVSKIALRSRCIRTLEEIEMLSNCGNVMIEKLEVYIDFNPNLFRNQSDRSNVNVRIASILNKIFATSQDTLKKLTLINCAPYLRFLEFPQIRKLKRVVLNYNFEDYVQFPNFYKFPPSFRFSEALPNLHEFHVESAGIGNQVESSLAFFMQLPLSQGPAPSVKKLSYSGYVDGETMGLIFQVFPNIEDLELPYTGCHESLWIHGKNLKKLLIVIHMIIYDEGVEDVVTLFDGFFTGFSEETIYNIMDHPKRCPYTLEELEELRVNPSILLLTELKEFTIEFVQDAFENPRDLPENMLAITGKYAFKLMPTDVRIRIGCFSSTSS